MMKAITFLCLVAALTICLSVPTAGQEQPVPAQATVASVESGNVVTLLADGKKLKVRLLGVDAPTQSFGRESRDNLSRLVKGKEVKAVVSATVATNVSGITSGELFVDGRNVGVEQVRDGLAWHVRDAAEYQSLAQRQTYAEAENSAKGAKRGLWGDTFKECAGAPVKTSYVRPAGMKAEDTKLPEVYGTVFVEVFVDQNGVIKESRALCGHPILQTLAARSALQARFKPQGNEMRGTITFNFAPEAGP